MASYKVKLKNNHYSYETAKGIAKGFFNIYQGKSGSVILSFNTSTVTLSYQQIQDLRIDVFALKDFDHDLFQKVYQIPGAANPNK